MQNVFSKTVCTRQYAINMPQMHWGGMSENWLQKELGDMHWSMTSDALGVSSDKLCDSNGERLYASFVRLRWESTAGLMSFTENQQVQLTSQLMRYGSKMFFSDAIINCDNENIKASLISVFSTRAAQDNTSLKKGTLAAPAIGNIHTVETLPDFAKQYLGAKANLFAASGMPQDCSIELAGTVFNLNAPAMHVQEYTIEPYDDVNGVGLLYFASYSKISDKCERKYFQQIDKANDSADWAQKSSCIARDILYFGNANPGEALIYELNGWQPLENNRIQLLSSLYRKSDKQLISKILTIKQLSAADIDRLGQPEMKYTYDTINKAIIDFFAKAMDIKNLDASTNLKALGIESIMFTELSEYLAAKFQLKSNPSRFFGLYTIQDITSYLLNCASAASMDAQAAKDETTASAEDIAIIGTSLRLPAAVNEEEFWQLLMDAKSAIANTPSERWDWPQWVDTLTTHKGINKGGYLNNIDEFDAAFFRISPKEAELMDPQQRILLELAWQLLESSGYKPSSQKGSNTGVYIGASNSDYELFLNGQHDEQTLGGTGTSLAILANRISYFFDLQGPSLQIDTACSSSLVAVHNAVQAIRRGECTQAIAGGIHLMCHPARSLAYYKSNMLSTDGACMTFDEKANGYVRGEGCVLLLLKPLSKAIADGDNIKGIIKSTAINHGGQTGGLTVPDPYRQGKLLEAAYTNAGIDISTVTYIETHGTGTSLGDPIEVAGIAGAFKNLQQSDNVKPWCGLGSVKTNIGHLEAASGIAGLMKVLLSMAHEYLPPTINFEKLNPKIEIEGSPFYIVTAAKPWTAHAGAPLRAGVSSFGIGGTNAHVVVENFRQQQQPVIQGKNNGSYVFVLSARNAERLLEYAQRIADHLVRNLRTDHEQLCYTLQVAREEMAERIAIAYREPFELEDALADYINGTSNSNIFTGNVGNNTVAVQDAATIDQWIKNGNIEKIASCWCKGAAIDWNLMYKKFKPQKINLPSYPFRKEKHWFKNRKRNIEAVAQVKEVPASLPVKQPVVAKETITERMEMSVIASKLSDAICDILYLDSKELNVNASFVELGLDSILGVELIKKVNGIFKTGIKTARIYDHPSVTELSTHIYQEVNAQSLQQEKVVQKVLASQPAASGKIKLNSTESFVPVVPSTPANVQISLSKTNDDKKISAAIPAGKDLVIYHEVSIANNACLRDHLVFGHHVLPTDAYLELVYAALKQHFKLQRVCLEGVRIHHPLLLHSTEVRTLKLELKDMGDGCIRFIISSKTEQQEIAHIRGIVNTAASLYKPSLTAPNTTPEASFTTEALRTAVKGAEIKGCYDRVRRSLHFSGHYGTGTLMVCAQEGNILQTSIAQVLDGALLFAIQAAARECANEIPGAIYLPYQVARLTINGQVSEEEIYTTILHCYKKGKEDVSFNLEVSASNGALLFAVEGLELRPVIASQLATGVAIATTDVDNNDIANADVAIIGLSCRLPGADNATEFWQNLTKGVDSIEEINAERWGGYDWYNADAHNSGTSYSKWGGFINDKDKFDALFFGISPYEAEIMDPQQRLFLEESWKALEDAAYDAKALARKKVSVFVGAGTGDYLHLMHQHGSGKEGAAFTGSSQAVLSARISYLLNLTGPSLAIDTACSSSLVAIDRACQSIVCGESEMAIAGGVALLNTPQLHVWTSQVGMPSANGRCKAFDDGADGIVSSEGVGVVILKKLEAAERDGDKIYAVIKGSGINQDGKTNGITAPSARSQTELQSGIFQKFSIDASTIGYVEAHGTGTKLGDPIEIDALTESFSKYTNAKQYCAIGSVKTNIGHASFAAGVAGVIKVALMLKHGKHVPSLHYNKTNSQIDIAGTPFYVNTELKDWPVAGTHPRRAAISSFGFSGTNAHVIVEEYKAVQKEYKTTVPALVVLSAKNAERLHEQARNLKHYLEGNRQLNVHDIAYTLQAGRTPMEIRLAFEAKDTSQIIAALGSFLSGEKRGLFYGDASAGDGFLLQGRAGKAYLETAIEARECASLAQLWVRGVNIDWNLLYAAEKPCKISLPAYPFAKERHWIQQSATHAHAKAAYKLHPLLHLNSSTLNEQQFKSVYTGTENFLADHIVLQQKMLPGTAHLELARAAGELSTEKKITCLKDVTWLSPVVADASGKEIYIRLHPLQGHVEYEVYTKGDAPGLHSHGILSTQPLTAPTRFDLTAIRKRLNNTTGKESWYAALAARGFNLGKTFQGIQMHYYNADEALSNISLPREEGYVLMPGLLDSALQNCLGWVLAANGQPLALPFSVKEILLYKELPETLWSYARKSKGNKANQQVYSYDIDLLDDEGVVLLSFRDFVFLPVLKTAQATQPALQLYETSWTTTAETIESGNMQSTPLVVLAGGAAVLADKLKETLEVEVEVMNAGNEEAAFMYVLNKIKQSVQQPTHIVVMCRNADYLQYGFLSGLLKTATLEHPQVTGKIVGVDDLSINNITELSSIITDEQHSPDAEVRYVNGKRMLKVTRPMHESDAAKNAGKIKEGGVYLVTGGTGSLGKIVAKHISGIKNTQLILTGRNDLGQTEISNAEYIRCDVSDKQAVVALIKHIKSRYHRLDGIIHCAGVIKDSLLLNKTAGEVQAVLASKIAGAKNVDEATCDEPLDFILFFSSIAGFKGNAGQCDYAAANAFLDGYAQWRNELQAQGKRYGKAISINWPLWQQGGMAVDKEVAANLERQWGMMPLPTAEGLKAFEIFLRNGTAQGLAVFGEQNKIADKLFKQQKQKQSDALPRLGTDNVQEQAAKKIISLAAQLLKLNEGVIQRDKELGGYGFDSVLFTKLANALNEYYDLSLLPVAFYNHPTVSHVAAFLAQEHYEELEKKHHSGDKPAQVDVNDYSVAQQGKPKTRFTTASAQPTPTGIAIVGMSGRFPGSANLESFWNNLKANKDLITEVPADRWDWKKYYGDPLQEKNKTKAKWGGFIEDMDKFDPLFFGISPFEAELMDPQQRITLQAVYEALEHAAISTDSIKGSNAGVFIGVSASDYTLLINNKTDLTGEAQFSTGSAHSMLVNRISYLLDIHGPSQPIDTACSSSLVAIHRAVESIRSGECHVAIAGGVNALLSPELTLSFSQAGMLSEDGRCKTFDQSANGYVRGEGVGIIILKSLNSAEADGDIIYGVIRGTAENHGGRANTLTSPNPQAQKELLLKAYRDANADPRDVSYIEAHGTGTPLGDPIETEALKLAFRELYKEKELDAPQQPYCALGSVKANIGHLESAAGIAGVVKVLLGLQHKMLPGNPHLKEPNAYLQLKDTPFYLQKETTEWSTQNDRPRIAGVSSFGFGGANAHVIVEEYPAKEKNIYADEQPAIIILSAKNSNRLKAQAGQLQSYLQTAANISLHDIAYTLQVGKSSLEERLAIVTDNINVLKIQLENYQHDKPGEYFTGNALAGIFSFGENNEPASIARRWVNGAVIDWNLLYPHQRPNKISLFTYPFAKEKYWIRPTQNRQHSDNKLHPLLHVSESSRQFLSSFSGREFFFEDHKVRGVKVLPGAAQLELAREAGERSSHKKITQLKDVVFMSPLNIDDQSRKIITRLQPDGEETEFIISDHEDSSHVFTRGKLNSFTLQSPAKQDLPLVKQRLTNAMSSNEYYDLLQLQGITYGTGFRGIQSIYYNNDEVLSKISMPENKEYVLPPGVLDSAVQTVMGLSFGFDKHQPLVLPFSVKEVNIYSPLPGTFWSYARKNNKQGAITTYNVHLLDESGKTLVELKEFFPLPAEGQKSMLYVPVWNRIKTNGAVLSKQGKHLLLGGYENTQVTNALKRLLQQQNCEIEEAATLQQVGEGITAIYLLHGLIEPGENSFYNSYRQSELPVFNAIKTLLSSGYKDKKLDITVLTSSTQKVHAADKVHAAGGGIAGLIGSLAREQALWNIRVIDIDAAVNADVNLSKILSVPYDEQGALVTFRNGYLYRKSLCPVDLQPGTTSKLRQGGTYVILGGAGGIGKVTTAYLIKEYKAQVIWIGRRPLDETIQQSLNEMEKLGVRPQYISCNAVDKASLQAAYKTIKASNHVVHGLFHSAIVLKDMLLKNMEEEDFKLSFEPKSLASHHLVEIFKDEPLDFICFYSSVQSHLNTAGQANYSAGCTYKDTLSHSIRQSLNIPSHVINWGYWGDEGVVSSDEYRQRMKSMGVGSISSKDGMQILETVLSNEMAQVAAIKFV